MKENIKLHQFDTSIENLTLQRQTEMQWVTEPQMRALDIVVNSNLSMSLSFSGTHTEWLYELLLIHPEVCQAHILVDRIDTSVGLS